MAGPDGKGKRGRAEPQGGSAAKARRNQGASSQDEEPGVEGAIGAAPERRTSPQRSPVAGQPAKQKQKRMPAVPGVRLALPGTDVVVDGAPHDGRERRRQQTQKKNRRQGAGRQQQQEHQEEERDDQDEHLEEDQETQQQQQQKKRRTAAGRQQQQEEEEEERDDQDEHLEEDQETQQQQQKKKKRRTAAGRQQHEEHQEEAQEEHQEEAQEEHPEEAQEEPQEEEQQEASPRAQRQKQRTRKQLRCDTSAPAEDGPAGTPAQAKHRKKHQQRTQNQQQQIDTSPAVEGPEVVPPTAGGSALLRGDGVPAPAPVAAAAAAAPVAAAAAPAGASAAASQGSPAEDEPLLLISIDVGSTKINGRMVEVHRNKATDFSRATDLTGLRSAVKVLLPDGDLGGVSSLTQAPKKGVVLVMNIKHLVGRMTLAAVRPDILRDISSKTRSHIRVGSWDLVEVDGRPRVKVFDDQDRVDPLDPQHLLEHMLHEVLALHGSKLTIQWATRRVHFVLTLPNGATELVRKAFDDAVRDVHAALSGQQRQDGEQQDGEQQDEEQQDGQQGPRPLLHGVSFYTESLAAAMHCYRNDARFQEQVEERTRDGLPCNVLVVEMGNSTANQTYLTISQPPGAAFPAQPLVVSAKDSNGSDIGGGEHTRALVDLLIQTRPGQASSQAVLDACIAALREGRSTEADLLKIDVSVAALTAQPQATINLVPSLKEHYGAEFKEPNAFWRVPFRDIRKAWDAVNANLAAQIKQFLDDKPHPHLAIMVGGGQLGWGVQDKVREVLQNCPVSFVSSAGECFCVASGALHLAEHKLRGQLAPLQEQQADPTPFQAAPLLHTQANFGLVAADRTGKQEMLCVLIEQGTPLSPEWRQLTKLPLQTFGLVEVPNGTMKRQDLEFVEGPIEDGERFVDTPAFRAKLATERRLQFISKRIISPTLEVGQDIKLFYRAAKPFQYQVRARIGASSKWHSFGIMRGQGGGGVM